MKKLLLMLVFVLCAVSGVKAQLPAGAYELNFTSGYVKDMLAISADSRVDLYIKWDAEQSKFVSVETKDAADIAILNTYFHDGQHGLCAGGFEIKTSYKTDITMGSCKWANPIVVKAGEEEIANLPQAGCLSSVEAKYFGTEATTLYVSDPGYMPYMNITVKDAASDAEPSVLAGGKYLLEFRGGDIVDGLNAGESLGNIYLRWDAEQEKFVKVANFDLADVMVTGKYHGKQHGIQSCQVKIKTSYKTNLKIGGCSFGNDFAVKANDVVIAELTKTDGCDGGVGSYNVYHEVAYKGSDPATIEIGNPGYLPYVEIEVLSAKQEKLLYSTSFSEWAELKGSSTPTVLNVNTKYSHEQFSFTLTGTSKKVTEDSKFSSVSLPHATLMAEKNMHGTIETSALAHISKVSYMHGATGNNRGWKLEAKGEGDEDWVVVCSDVADPASGAVVEKTINKNNCQLRFTNLVDAQNAYMFELNIYGVVDFGNQPVLGDITYNGITVAAGDVCNETENGMEATLEVSKTTEMVSATNAISVKVVNGDLGEITYAGDDKSCVVKVPVTLNDKSVNYILKFVQKPDFTVSYNGVGNQTVEKDAKIAAFKYGESDLTIPEGCKFRGWFYAESGLNNKEATVDDVITGDKVLYPVITKIEEGDDEARYQYVMIYPNFNPEHHEAISFNGGKYYNNHGWIYKEGESVTLNVEGNAYILLGLCEYSSSKATITLSDENATISATEINMKAASDGASMGLSYTGGKGTVTITFGSGTTYLHQVVINNFGAQEVSLGEFNVLEVVAGDVNDFLKKLDIANALSSEASPVALYLPDGLYDLGELCLTIISGANISIIGQSMENTIIKNTAPVEGIGVSGTLLNTSKNLYMQDLTLVNGYDYYQPGAAGRAICLQDKGNQTILKNVKMLSYQDTYYTNADNMFYAEGCEIHGCVDFICGNGDVYFNKCTLVLESRKKDVVSGDVTIAAPAGDTEFGYIFEGCTIDASRCATFNYGRAWQKSARTAYLNTILLQPTKLIASRFTAAGMNTMPTNFYEYKTVDADGNDITPSTNVVKFSYNGTTTPKETILNAEQAAAFAYDKMFTSWDPASIAVQYKASEVVLEDNVLTWTAAEGATGYAVFVDNKLTAITAETSVSLAAGVEPEQVTVRALNTRFGMGEAVKIGESTPTAIGQDVNAEVVAVDYYSISGAKLAAPVKGINVVKVTLSNGEVVVEKKLF